MNKEILNKIDYFVNLINQDQNFIKSVPLANHHNILEINEAKRRLSSLQVEFSFLYPFSTYLLNDYYFLKEYDIIELYEVDDKKHGLNHLFGTNHIMRKLITYFGIDNRQADALMTALLFRDIGLRKKEFNKADESVAFAQNYFNNHQALTNACFDKGDVLQIMDAILFHDSSALTNMTFFELLVVLADKLDNNVKRFRQPDTLHPFSGVDKIDIIKISNKLELLFLGNYNFDLESFKISTEVRLLKNVFLEICKRCNLQPHIYCKYHKGKVKEYSNG